MPQRPLKVVILAAGKSTRMKSDTPKVLHKLAGVPMLQWVLDQAAALNTIETIVVVGFGGEQVKEQFSHHRALKWVTQEPQLGTGHAVMQCRDLLADHKGDVAILCGDVPLLRARTLNELREMHTEKKSACTVMTARVPDPRGYGRIQRDKKGHVTRIVEQKDLQPAEDTNEINTGTYIFDAPELLKRLDRLKADNAQSEYYLTDVVQMLVADGKKVRASVVQDHAETLGINDRKQLAIAERRARRRICEFLMVEMGVTITDPRTTYIEAGVQIGRDTVIYPCSVIRTGVEIGKRCEIGPFAHIRGGTRLFDGCKVGAFVETKNAVFDEGAKAGHLAYLGDVSIGKKANIGAGTIVANYDGEEKHHTSIGDNAFIGCGTVLVAPVRVGKNAQTGANTVVPRGKDVPENTVVVGAPARELKKRG